MIEYELAWKLTDDQAKTLQRETLAILKFLLRRRKSATRREFDISKTIALAAVVESLAIVIAGYTSREDDDQTIEELLETLTYTLKRSVRQIRASDVVAKLIARLQATKE